MARDAMILMLANPFRGPLEGVGPDNRDFLGPECSVADQWHFGMDPDTDPRIHASI